MSRIVVTIMALLFIHMAYARTINVGSEMSYKPFTYADKDGKSIGFDNDVIRLVAGYIKDIKLHFVAMPWNAIFSSLDSGRVDIAINQIAKTKEREEKYIFSNKPYFYGVSALIVGKGSKANSLEDLNGKKIGVTLGSNHANNIERYLKEHPNIKISLVYYKNTPPLFADLANTRLAGIVNDPIVAKDYAQAQNIDIRATNVYFDKVPVYLIFRKQDKELRDIFSEALDKAIADGKIDSLIESYFGKDYLDTIKNTK